MEICVNKASSFAVTSLLSGAILTFHHRHHFSSVSPAESLSAPGKLFGSVRLWFIGYELSLTYLIYNVCRYLINI